MARDRADREYEKFEEKNQHLTPQRYSGNPTYAILEIENRLKSRASGIFNLTNGDLMDSNKKSTTVDSNVKKSSMDPPATPVKNREAMNNVIKSKTKLRSPKRGKKRRRGKRTPTKVEQPIEIPQEIEEPKQEIVEEEEDNEVQVPIEVPKRRRGRPAKKAKTIKTTTTIPQPDIEENNSIQEAPETINIVNKKKRGRKPTSVPKTIEIPFETEEEEASVYYDIPGEGSNDSIKDISEDENQPKIFASKRARRNILLDDEDSNSNLSAATSVEQPKRNKRSRYYNDEDFDVSQEEDDESVVSEMTIATKSSDLLPLKRKKEQKPSKSRSTSRATFIAKDDESEEEPTVSSDEDEEESYADNDSEYQLQDSEDESNADQGVDLDDDEEDEDDDEDEESGESEMADDYNDSNDSIDIKYSPIKTRNARRTFTTKQVRGKILMKFIKFSLNFNKLFILFLGRRINDLDEETRNFRLVSTQG